nr:RAD55 family ATPase [Candidatus Njordarchaeum guaymaensis]
MKGDNSSASTSKITVSSSSLSSPVERIPSGITELDRILSGGFPSGTFNCIEGDIGTGTSTFCIQALWSRLILGGLASFMCLDEPPERVIEHFKSFGWDVKPYIEEKHILLYDGHVLLNSLASATEGQNGVAERKALLGKFLDDYRKETCAILRTHPKIIVPAVTAVDSFSSIAPYVDLKSAYVLAHMIANSARKNNNLLLAVVHTGALEANIVCACNAVADGILRLDYILAKTTLRRVMRVEKLAFTPIPVRPLEYVITSKNGIELIGEAKPDEKPVGNSYAANGTRMGLNKRPTLR